MWRIHPGTRNRTTLSKASEPVHPGKEHFTRSRRRRTLFPSCIIVHPEETLRPRQDPRAQQTLASVSSFALLFLDFLQPRTFTSTTNASVAASDISVNMTQHEMMYGTSIMPHGTWNPSRRCDPDHSAPSAWLALDSDTLVQYRLS